MIPTYFVVRNAKPKVDLRELVRPGDTTVASLERALFCKACSGTGKRYRVRADILGLMGDPDDPNAAHGGE